jgi:hypothetical protein
LVKCNSALDSNFDSIYRSSREPYSGSSIGKVLQGENVKQVKSILTEKKKKRSMLSPKKIGAKKSSLKKPALVDDAGTRRASNVTKLSSVGVCLDGNSREARLGSQDYELKEKGGKISSQVNCVVDTTEFTRASKKIGRKSDMLPRKVSRLTEDAKSPYANGQPGYDRTSLVNTVPTETCEDRKVSYNSTYSYNQVAEIGKTRNFVRQTPSPTQPQPQPQNPNLNHPKKSQKSPKAAHRLSEAISPNPRDIATANAKPEIGSAQDLESLAEIRNLKPPIHSKNNKYNRGSSEYSPDLPGSKKLASTRVTTVANNSSGRKGYLPNQTKPNSSIQKPNSSIHDRSTSNDIETFDSILENFQSQHPNSNQNAQNEKSTVGSVNFSPRSSNLYGGRGHSPRGIFSDLKHRADEIKNLKSLKNKILLHDRLHPSTRNFDVIGLSIEPTRDIATRQTLSRNPKNYTNSVSRSKNRQNALANAPALLQKKKMSARSKLGSGFQRDEAYEVSRPFAMSTVAQSQAQNRNAESLPKKPGTGVIVGRGGEGKKFQIGGKAGGGVYCGGW